MSDKTNYFFRQGLIGLCLLGLLGIGEGCNNKSDKKTGTNPDLNPNKVSEVNPDANPGPTYVRKNCSSTGGQADMEAMSKALAIMKNTPCSNVTSWYYQGAIHWVTDPGDVTNNVLCPTYTGPLDTAWQNCTHTANGANIHFLIWHRLYTYFFERIVRKYSGKSDFAIPYWKYVDPLYRVMPAIFRDPKDSLYELARDKTLNQGQPISKSFADQYLVGGMQTANQSEDYEVFNSNIENAPHNYMHGYIGGSGRQWNIIYQQYTPYGMMADATSAGFDPVFWIHHSNIDYLWEKWYDSTGKQPDLAELEQTPWKYQFFDENGKYISYTIAEALDKAMHLDYTYDDLPPVKITKTNVPKNKKQMLSMDLVQPVSKLQQQVNVKVDNKVILENMNENFTRKATILELTVSYKTAPKSGYTVYINTDKPDPKKVAGYINFFGVEHMLKHMAGMEASKVFLFDISAEYDIKSVKDNVKLLIVNSSGKPATEITVKKIRIETRDF
jgi:hypothetical protein